MHRAAWVILLAVLVSACQAITPDQNAVAITRAVYDELRSGQDTALAARIHPGMITPATAAQFSKLRTFVPVGEPTGSKVVSSSVAEVKGHGRYASLSIEYDYPDRAALFRTQLYEPPGAHVWQVKGFNLEVATERELAVNRLTLANRSVVQGMFLALAIASPLLMLAALVKVIRTPGLERKWLWGLMAFLGLFTFHANWSTGYVLVQWYSLQFLGFGLTPAPSRFDPWFVDATVPLGALLILAGIWATPLVARKPVAPKS